MSMSEEPEERVCEREFDRNGNGSRSFSARSRGVGYNFSGHYGESVNTIE